MQKETKVLAIASGGGHWIQLLRLRPAFAGCRISFASVDREAKHDVEGHRYFMVPDGNRDTKLSLIWMALRVLAIVLIVRPNVIVSTGAAPGYFACRFGKFVGAKSLFIDSVANAEEMSLSAKLVASHANRVFSQWPRVAEKFGVECHGSVL